MITLKMINAAIVILGVPSIIGACIYIGRKLQVLDHLEERLNKLQEDFDEDHEHVIGFKLQGYGIHHSPYQPNEKGERILNESGWYKVYPIIKEDVAAKMSQRKPKTLYDVEKIAMDVLVGFKNDDRTILFKEYVVNNPDVSLPLIYAIGSWLVRDEYAKKFNIVK